MSRVFNSSVDMVVLTDYMMKQLVLLAEKWGKSKGEAICFKTREKQIKRVRILQKRFVDSTAGKITQYWHDSKDEDAIFELGKWITFKSAQLQGFSEPSKPWTEGETFSREALRSATPLTSDTLARGIAELGKMMQAGSDPIEASQDYELMMKPEPKKSAGGIILEG